jgi:hypothetical protein
MVVNWARRCRGGLAHDRLWPDPAVQQISGIVVHQPERA